MASDLLFLVFFWGMEIPGTFFLTKFPSKVSGLWAGTGDTFTPFCLIFPPVRRCGMDQGNCYRPTDSWFPDSCNSITQDSNYFFYFSPFFFLPSLLRLWFNNWFISFISNSSLSQNWAKFMFPGLYLGIQTEGVWCFPSTLSGLHAAPTKTSRCERTFHLSSSCLMLRISGFKPNFSSLNWRTLVVSGLQLMGEKSVPWEMKIVFV